MKGSWGRRPVDAAVIYARRGWEVFPCHSPAKGSGACTCAHVDCGSPAKHPRVKGGLNAATTDEDVIRRWWASWPSANVAIRTGAASGLVVVDIDPDHGGDRSLDALLSEHGPLPTGRTIRTGSGGRHLYFSHPGHSIPNDAGRRLGAGLDVRGDGGYVIAPPSVHASGGR
ncbi:MAG: putative primase/helicase, partial [Actinomycetota bacterium]